MNRTKPMSRGAGFKSKAQPPRPVKRMDGYTARPRPMAVPAAAANAADFNPQPKDEPVQHQGYMALARGLPCDRCGWFRKGFMQFCHADMLGQGGKGMGMKSDVRLGYPGCGPHDGLPGCHFDIGTARVMPKSERHLYEAEAGARTRTAILDAGMWPARLPKWSTPCP